MINKTREQAMEDMRRYNADDFDRYVCEAGWESWMEEYTDSKDGEECIEQEIKAIENEQAEMWQQVHG
jgi:hypothetical protein